MADEISKIADLSARTKSFAVRIIRLFGALPKNNIAAQVIGKQLLRSGTSVGAQYREAARARSRAEFVSKIESCLQEIEETRYWFDLLAESEIVADARLKDIMQEAKEITAMLTASARTSKSKSAR